MIEKKRDLRTEPQLTPVERSEPVKGATRSNTREEEKNVVHLKKFLEVLLIIRKS